MAVEIPTQAAIGTPILVSVIITITDMELLKKCVMNEVFRVMDKFGITNEIYKSELTNDEIKKTHCENSQDVI